MEIEKIITKLQHTHILNDRVDIGDKEDIKIEINPISGSLDLEVYAGRIYYNGRLIYSERDKLYLIKKEILDILKSLK